MLYKIHAKKGYAHLWTYDRFREAVNGQLVEYDVSGNLIRSITYKVPHPISRATLDEYGLAGKLLSK